MPRLLSPTAELVVEAGRPAGSSPYLSLDAADDLGVRGTRHFFAIVEPVSLVPGVEDAAGELLARLRAEIDRHDDQTATAALLGAVESANEWLYDINADRPPALQFLFGAAIALARDDELFLAQIQPSQILIGQEGELYAFPGLETWRWHQLGEEDGAVPQPLGQRGFIEPELYHTRIAPGDLVVLCSTSLARVIEREAQDVFVQGDADAATVHLGYLARTYALEDAHAVAVAVPSAPASQTLGRVGLLRRVGDLCAQLLPEETVHRFRRRARNRHWEVDQNDAEMQTLEYPEDASEADVDDEVPFDTVVGTAERDTRPSHTRSTTVYPPFDEALDDDACWGPTVADDFDVAESPATDAEEGRGKLTELLAGAILALSAAVVGVWQLTVHRDRSIGEPRDDGTLGLPRLHRYEDSPQLPDFISVRRRLPRAPINRLTGLVAISLVVVLIGALAFSIHNNRVRDRQAKIEQLLQTAVQHRQQAAQSSSPAAAQAYLSAASARLDQAVALGLEPQLADQERAAINDSLDQALKIERLANVQVIGGVPPAPEGTTPRLFFGNGQLYVFTDALYRLDADGTTLVRLLGPGDQVDGQPVAQLLGAAWGDGSPIAVDGNNAYLLDPTTAVWSRHPLGTFGSPYSGIVATNGYGGNLYMLSPGSGQILKFPAGAFDAQPEDWTGGLASGDLESATDMEIDGRIYVLLADGRVLTFYMSALESTSTTEVTPPIENAVALSAQPERPFVYVADSHARILRLTRDGQLVQQFMAADGAPSLDGIRDIAIDDVLGSGYILTDNALLSVRLPGPPR